MHWVGWEALLLAGWCLGITCQGDHKWGLQDLDKEKPQEGFFWVFHPLELDWKWSGWDKPVPIWDASFTGCSSTC